MKKNQVLLIGTHNNGKFKEISKLLHKKIKTISPKSLEIESPKETGKTFKENSELKANFFYKKSKLVSLSDDSGIEILALNKKPGIYSARWAKKSGSFKKTMISILKKIKNKKNRKARFICSLSIKLHERKIVTSVGVINGHISLLLGSVIATICACFAYLPSHEAQHGNYSRGNPKRRWIDSFVSHYTLITLMFPHDVMRATHMKHHAYTNNPEKDPDHDTASAKSIWEVIVATQAGISKYQAIAQIYENDKAFMKSFNKGLNVGMLYRVILLTLVVFFPLETLLLWWLPSKFGVIYLSVFFSWYPHYQTETGRYKDTRFWSHWMPRYLNHSMQLHFIHHLHPGIGHYDEPKAIEALKPFLVARGVPGAEDIPDKVKHNPLIKA